MRSTWSRSQGVRAIILNTKIACWADIPSKTYMHKQIHNEKHKSLTGKLKHVNQHEAQTFPKLVTKWSKCTRARSVHLAYALRYMWPSAFKFNLLGLFGSIAVVLLPLKVLLSIAGAHTS